MAQKKPEWRIASGGPPPDDHVGYRCNLCNGLVQNGDNILVHTINDIYIVRDRYVRFHRQCLLESARSAPLSEDETTLRETLKSMAGAS